MTTAAGKAKLAKSTSFADSKLVKECLAGNEGAWSDLINKYKNLIYSIPVRYGFSAEDSADIYQAVCMDLLKELPRLREPDALAGWLIQVARNKCYHRKQAEKQTAGQEEDVDEAVMPGSEEAPENLAVQVQQEQFLREALQDVSPRCRKLVEMLFFEVPARPYEEVAHELDLATGSIGFIRKRCLETLRQRLKQMGI